MQVIFETERLVLRRFTLADAPLLLRLNSDPEVLKYLHEPLVETEKRAREVLNEIILPQYELNLGRWAIHQKTGMEFIGWCGLKSRPEINEIDLGYRLIRSAWGKGFATEAAKRSLEYGFEALRLQTITGRAHVDNLASLKILEKIGMKYTRDEIIDHCPVKTYIANANEYMPAN